MRIMRISIDTLSAWVSFLKPKFQKMSSIRWKRPLLINETFLTTAPLEEYLWQKMQEVKKQFTHSINQTLTRRFEHRAMRPRSFHTSDETWRFSQCRDKLTYPAQGKWKTYYDNATRHTKINHIIAITEIMNIIITTVITRRQTLTLWPRICVLPQRG